MQEILKMKAPNRQEVEILGGSFEEGTPQGEMMGKWNNKLSNRSEILKYLQTGQRYFFSAPDEVFGSEKRKKPA